MNLLNRSFQSIELEGANQILVQGRMGSGKTTLMRAYADQAIRKHHAVIWRARPNRDQWHLLEGERKILVPEDSQVNFSQDIQDQLHEYSGPADLLRKLHGGLNIVIEPNLTKPWDAIFWLSFWRFLNQRKRFTWATMIYDEVKDTFPSQSYGAYYFIMPQVSSVFRDMRRSRTEFMATIHEPRDIHWDWVGKYQTVIYMHGATRINGRRIKQGLISHLESGHILVELRDEFADVRLNIPDSQYPKSHISYDLVNPKEYHKRLDRRTMEYIEMALGKDIIEEISGAKGKKKGKQSAPAIELEESP